MAKQGRAGPALAIAAIVSFIAGGAATLPIEAFVRDHAQTKGSSRI
jgi:TctA family transporter